MCQELRIDDSCPDRLAYTKESFQSFYGDCHGLKKWDVAKPCVRSKEGWLVPYPAGAEQMTDTMVNLSLGVRFQNKKTVVTINDLLPKFEETNLIEIVTGPNLDKMGEMTADGNMRAYTKQNILNLFKGIPILSIVLIAEW